MEAREEKLVYCPRGGLGKVKKYRKDQGDQSGQETIQALAGGLVVCRVISTANGETAEDDLRETPLGIEKVSCSRPTNLNHLQFNNLTDLKIG